MNDRWNKNDELSVFNVGDKVRYQSGASWDTWVSGTIISSEKSRNVHKGYYFQSVSKEKPIFIRVLSTNKFRPLDFDVNNPLHFLAHHMQYNTSIRTIVLITETKQINLSDKDCSTLLILTITNGKPNYFEWLLAHNINCSLGRDEKGRSILQLVMMNRKRLTFLKILEKFDSNANNLLRSLMEMSDSSGSTVLHYLVTYNVEAMTDYFLCGEDRLTQALYKISFDNPLEARKDFKGRVALTSAKSLRRTRLVAQLEEFSSSVGIFRGLHTMCLNPVDSKEYAKGRTLVFRPHWKDATFSRFLTAFVKVAAYKLVEKYCFADAQQLVATFAIHDLNFNSDTLYEQECSLIHQIVKGSSDMWLSKDVSVMSGQSESLLRDALHELLSTWNGVDDVAEFITNQRRGKTSNEHAIMSEWTYPALHTPNNTSDSQRDLICLFIDRFVNRQQDKQSDTRIAMLSWAVYDLYLPLPALYLLVRLGQFRLLRWMCDSGLVNPSAHLSASPDLLEFAQTLDWASSADCDRLTVAEFLCALAASLDELQIFQWLFAEKIADRTFRVGEEGMNMLHLAAQCGSYIVVRTLLNNHKMILLLTNFGRNALHLALLNRHVRVASILSRFIPTELCDFDGKDSLHYADTLREQHPDSPATQTLREQLRRFKEDAVFLTTARENPNAFATVWTTINKSNFIDAFYEICVSFRDDDDSEIVDHTVFLLMKELDCQLGEFTSVSPSNIALAVVVLAARQGQIEFLCDLRSSLRVKMFKGRFDESYSDRDCLLAVLKSLVKQSSFAASSLLFLEEWRGEVLKAGIAECEAHALCGELYNLITNKNIVPKVVECYQRQRACLREADRDPFLFTHSYVHIFSNNVKVPKAEISLFEFLVLNQRTLVLEWILTHNMASFESIKTTLTYAVSRANYLSIPKLLTKHLLQYEGENEPINSTFKGEASKKALLFDMVVLCVMPEVVKPPSAVDCRFSIFKDLFVASVMFGVDLTQFVATTKSCVETQANLVQLAAMNMTRGDARDSDNILNFLLRQPRLWGMINVRCNSNDQPAVVMMISAFLHNLQERFSGQQTDDKACQGYLGKFVNNLLPLLITRGLQITLYEREIVAHLASITQAKAMSGVTFLLTHFATQYGFDAKKYVIFSDVIKTLIADVVRQHKRVTAALILFTEPKVTDTKCLLGFERTLLGTVTVSEFRHKHRCTLLHLAAQSDRVGMLKTLIFTHNLEVSTRDDTGETALQYAQRAGASKAERYFNELFVFKFVWKRRCKIMEFKVRRLRVASATKIQSVARMRLTFKQHHAFLLSRRLGRSVFRSTWGDVVAFLSAFQTESSELEVTWSSIKRQHDMQVSEAFQRAAEQNDMIELISIAAQSLDYDPPDNIHEEEGDFTYSAPSSATNSPTKSASMMSFAAAPVLDTIELSLAAIQWLESADGRYKSLFAKKMERLAEGDRSYAMSKRLKGCVYPVYETKLDSGQRILWTELKRDQKRSILVWFVSKHDDVSKLVDHIDKSYLRLSSQPSILDDSTLELSGEDTLLDPTGNCPLKIYTTTRGDIPLLTTVGYTPPLRLGTKQQEVQEMSGTVLLLGRSGTGKTVCISDRMTRDREYLRVTSGVVASQLFVSRSRRLCEFIRSYQIQHTVDKSELDSVDVMPLDQFVIHMESVVNKGLGDVEKAAWPDSRRVDFEQFVAIMALILASCGLDAIVVWTQIRSFIKGSIETVLQSGHLSLDQYLDEKVFGLERCRLLTEQRLKAYAVYKQYQDVLVREVLWDDADRVLELLIKSKLQPLCACNGKGGDYHKVYVDEVQDNTQAEIVLYFLAAGMNTQSLFLAGDPAQSVVEGVDFRFEDVRSIVFKLSGGTDNIARPIKLLVNYRSHAGILNCAAAILDKMFAMFPGSAKVLPRDAGLFKGPRPAFCSVSGVDTLLSVLRLDQRMVVICPDSRVAAVEAHLSGASVANLVLGIRAAKGLEFQDIVLYDFFSSIPLADHKAWRSLLSDEHLEPYSHPQIESQLKLLYTAITRSCNRLIFAESERTSLFTAFVRWLKAKDLAEPFVLATDGETAFMTSDEWRVRGIDFASSAEGDNMIVFLRKAIHCFNLAGDKTLLSRAQTQLDLEITHKKQLSANNQHTLSLRQEHEVANLVLRGLKLGQWREVCKLLEGIEEVVKEVQQFRIQVLYVLLGRKRESESRSSVHL